MGCTAKQRGRFTVANVLRISLAIGLTLMSSNAISQEVDLDIVVANQETVYQLGGGGVPRLGRIVAEATFSDTGMNFRLCSGELADIDINILIPTNRTCDGKRRRAGTLTYADYLGEDAVAVYNHMYQVLGYTDGIFESDGESIFIVAPDSSRAQRALRAEFAISLDPSLSGLKFATNEAGEPIIFADTFRPWGTLPNIWVDPNGCEHFIMDNGSEGWMSPRLDINGNRVCN